MTGPRRPTAAGSTVDRDGSRPTNQIETRLTGRSGASDRGATRAAAGAGTGPGRTTAGIAGACTGLGVAAGVVVGDVPGGRGSGARRAVGLGAEAT